jgi:hypothetical protein
MVEDRSRAADAMQAEPTATRWGWRVFAISALAFVLTAVTRSWFLAGAAAMLFGLSLVAFTIDGLRTEHPDARGAKRYVRQRHPVTFWFLVILYIGFGIVVSVGGVIAMLRW